MQRRVGLVLAVPLLVAVSALPAAAAPTFGRPSVAALQVGLRDRGLYKGTIDGIIGPQTTRAVRKLQRRAKIGVDGVAGPKTVRALGRFSRHRLGSRPLRYGATGWDVVALEFELATHGFPSGAFDGRFGPHVDDALRRFQSWAGLPRNGVTGASTLAALRRPPPRAVLPLAWPVTKVVLGNRFGPRGDGFHAGIDLKAPVGTPVYAARAGKVVYANWAQGWGYLVVLDHGHGERTFYAYLSKIAVRLGVWVGKGVQLGSVGKSGAEEAGGPHLHFEVRVRGAVVNPLPALP